MSVANAGYTNEMSAYLYKANYKHCFNAIYLLCSSCRTRNLNVRKRVIETSTNAALCIEILHTLCLVDKPTPTQHVLKIQYESGDNITDDDKTNNEILQKIACSVSIPSRKIIKKLC